MINVLIPTDFSENATCAIKYATHLYANIPCTFYFLHSTHMFNPESRTHITPNYIDQLHVQGLNKLENLQLKYTNPNHIYKSILSKQKLSLAVKKVIEEKNIELIVMGTKGTTAAREYFVGSTTVSVIKKIKPCSVLVIPNYYTFIAPKQIAFPTEYSRDYGEIELKPLLNLAQHFNAHINILHINTEPELSDIQEKNKALLQQYLIDFKHSFHELLNISKKSETIENFITTTNIDLLVMVNYKHSFIENILKEPVIKNLVFQPKIPLLIIPK